MEIVIWAFWITLGVILLFYLRHRSLSSRLEQANTKMREVPEHEKEVVKALVAEIEAGMPLEEVLPGWRPFRGNTDHGAPGLFFGPELDGHTYILSAAGERQLYLAWRNRLLLDCRKP